LTACYTDGINQLVGDLTTQQAANFNHQEGLWLLDFNYSWQINAASGINASVRNLFAEEPPITTGGNGAFFNRNRRTYSLQFTHSFAN
jgi:outer membrane receptor protein involved in Fe transport